MPAGLRDEVGVEDLAGAGELVREGVRSSSSMRFAEELGPAEFDAAPAPLRLWRPLLCVEAMVDGSKRPGSRG